MRTIYGLILTMALCLGAWAADSTIHGLPNGTAPLPADVTIIDRESPPGTWHNYKLPLSSIATTQVITTNYYTFGTNYYYNDTYVSNYFETNILVDATSSNYFATYNYVTNTYQTNVTIEQYISNNSYVSNYVTTNIFNDTYTSNYFATNLFPTTYVYVTNTIGGAFIANNGGEGTNTVLRGNTLITKAYGDGSGLTNLPGGSQVWTNDGFVTWLSGYSPVDTNYNGSVSPGPPFFFRNDGSLFIGTNITWNVDPTPMNVLCPINALSFMHSNQAPKITILLDVIDNTNDFAMESQASFTAENSADGSGGNSELRLNSYGTSSGTEKVELVLKADSKTHDLPFWCTTNNITIAQLTINGEWIANKFTGDGSGLTNLTAVQDIIYNNTNIFNVAKGGTLVITNNIHPVDASWSGPTNLISYTNALQNYTALVPCSITNTANVMGGVGNSCLLCITNASSTNITVLVPATFKVGYGDTNPYTCTNGTILELWFYESSGRKTVTARGFN